MARQSKPKGVGRPPKWLTDSETYGEAVTDPRLVNESRWEFMTHVPHSEEYMRPLRAKGIRVFPYMSFYQAPIGGRYQGYRISEHTDWIMIDRDGSWRRNGFWESEDQKNWYCPCPNVKGYSDALMAYLERLLKAGANGIFLDNVEFKQECCGPEHGAHKHMYPTQMQACDALLERTTDLIRSYDPEGALLGNTAESDYWPFMHAGMSESFICTWVSNQRWGDWHKFWNQLDEKSAAALKEGKQICCLSYLGHTPYSLKDDAFFCYASARLMNLIWTAGGNKLADNEANVLYRIRTGRPVSKKQAAANGIYFRIFQHGMVAVNPTNRDLSLQVEHDFPTNGIWDVYNNDQIAQKGGRVRIPIPKQSGRVYVWNPTGQSMFSPAATDVLTVKTEPGLGKTQFKVDGILLETSSGRWTTKYVKEENYGAVRVDFDKPGTHVVEAVDLERKELRVATSYEAAYLMLGTEMPGQVRQRDKGRLSVLVDPARPTKFITGPGAPYRFQRWSGAASSASPTVKVKVSGPTVLIAHYKRGGK